MGFTKKEDVQSIDLSSLSAPAAAQGKPIPVPANVLNPESQAYINSSMAEALKDLMAQLAEAKAAAASNSFTPEALANAFAAAEKAKRDFDPATQDRDARKKREAREKAMTQEDVESARKNLALSQENCSHAYPNGAPSIARTMNYPDRQPRFSCMKCMLWIAPRQWVIDAPTEQHPRGVERIADAHPLYAATFKQYQVTHNE